MCSASQLRSGYANALDDLPNSSFDAIFHFFHCASTVSSADLPYFLESVFNGGNILQTARVVA